MANEWHKGAPPSIGWWPASMYKDRKMIRWWDGSTWSTTASADYSAKEAANCANFKAFNSDRIEWTDRWWL